MNKSVKPDITGLNQLEAGIMIQKYICILAMLNYGTAAEKQTAKQHLVELEEILPMYLNDAAFNSAIENLGWHDEEVKLFNAI